MDQPGSTENFAGRLQALRVRSGQSYEDLARRTFTSRSTLHRYCTGAGLPVDDEVVTRLGAACGADPTELDDLVRRWKAALAERNSGSPLGSPAPAGVPVEPAPPTDGLGAGSAGPRRARWVAAGVAVVVAGGAGFALRGAGADASAQGSEVCASRTGVIRADGPSGAFSTTWTAEQVCPNRASAPVFLTPLTREDDLSAQAGTLYSTESWFVCWTTGRMHAGGNRVWYYTQGDVSHPDHRDRRAWGFVPAVFVNAVTDPVPGMPQCPGMPLTS